MVRTGLEKATLQRNQPAGRVTFLLKLLNVLFQISGAEKMYLKGYGLSRFKEEKYDLRD